MFVNGGRTSAHRAYDVMWCKGHHNEKLWAYQVTFVGDRYAVRLYLDATPYAMIGRNRKLLIALAHGVTELIDAGKFKPYTGAEFWLVRRKTGNLVWYSNVK